MLVSLYNLLLDFVFEINGLFRPYSHFLQINIVGNINLDWQLEHLVDTYLLMVFVLFYRESNKNSVGITFVTEVTRFCIRHAIPIA